MQRFTCTKRSSLFLLILPLLLAALYSSSAHAGRIGSENRQPIDQYAASHKMSPEEARRTFGASGRIMCPFGEASAFLLFKPNVVVTARHVLFPEKSMTGYAGRPQILRCGFEVSDGKTSTWHKVDVSSFIYPDGRQRSPSDRFDWVVMRLSEPVTEFEPYRLPANKVRVGDSVIDATIRQANFLPDDWNERIITPCKIRAIDNIDHIAASGLRTDCSSNIGASGSPILREGPQGMEAVGIMSSSSETCPKFNRRNCYSFAVGLEPELLEAVHRIAGE